MKKKILLAFTAMMMGSLYGEALGVADAVVPAPAENDIAFEDNQGPPADPLKDVTTKEDDDDVSSEEMNDPLEPLNRALFSFNQIIDGLILRPVAVVYRSVFPEPVRESVTNVLSNLWGPVSFVNYLLQGNPNEAGVAITRFAINSTLGLAGTMDVANMMDVSGKGTGFDDTLAVWGITPGPYLVLPVLGPSTFRGVVGLTADYYADPFNYYFTHKKRKAKRRWMVYTRTGVEIIDKRYQLLDTLDELEANSIDFYAAIRSIHLQHLAYKKQRQSPQKEVEVEAETK